jgi:hypothetical protein
MYHCATEEFNVQHLFHPATILRLFRSIKYLNAGHLIAAYVQMFDYY